jgi:hypothetical protein
MAEDELKQLKTREARLAFSEKVDSYVGAGVGATAAVAGQANTSLWVLLALAAIACLLLMHFSKTELGQIRSRIREVESATTSGKASDNGSTQG